ncbi:hypothetical protein FI667_g7075, partial [Globisporangium splendens]
MEQDPNQTAAAQPLPVTKASTSALYMTPSPSELSMFGEADVDDELELEEDAARAEARRLMGRSHAADRNVRTPGTGNGCVVRFEKLSDAGAITKAERQKLMRELLDALYLGTSNFLLAYNTRAGIGVLLRIFKLLLKRNVRAMFDLKQLLDEKHLSFRVDAVSFGLFLGWFTGGYRGLRALLPFLVKKYLVSNAKKKGALIEDLQYQKRIEQLSALTSGAIAGCALMFVDAKKRRSFALYALTRALQCAYNTAKRNDYWHFWGSDWKYGDALLFAVSSAQVMYAYVMRPSTLPPEYFRFIQNTGPVERETLTLVQQSNRGLPIDQKLLWSLIKRKSINAATISKLPQNIGDIVPCRLVHCNAESCTMGWTLCFRRSFTKTFPLYLSLFIVPSVVIHFKKFLASPFRTLSRAVLGATRSNTFLASFVTAYLALICAHRRLTFVDHRIVYYLAGLGASTTILLEPKSRRSELALYVLPRAIDSLYMILRDRNIISGVRNGEVVLFSASMAVMMYCYEHEKESVSPFLYSIMKRFLSTAADKKKAYLATLRQKKEAREQQERGMLQQM